MLTLPIYGQNLKINYSPLLQSSIPYERTQYDNSPDVIGMLSVFMWESYWCQKHARLIILPRVSERKEAKTNWGITSNDSKNPHT